MRKDLETTDEAGAAESAALVDVLAHYDMYGYPLDMWGRADDDECGCGHDPACPHP